VGSTTFEYRYEEPPVVKGLTKAKVSGRLNFRELCREYVTTEDSKVREEIGTVEPLIVRAFNVLGASKIRSLEYYKGKIEKALLMADKKASSKSKIMAMLKKKGYSTGKVIHRSRVREDLEAIYMELGLEVKAKTSDIGTFFKYRATTRGNGMGGYDNCIVIQAAISTSI
jgi:hypothetical protein